MVKRANPVISIYIPEGWKTLVKILEDFLDWHLKENSHIHIDVHKDNFEVIQIKEKFGGLRYYTNGAICEEFMGAIAFAENYSYHICEKCGDAGKLSFTHTGWAKTLCDKHRAELGYVIREQG